MGSFHPVRKKPKKRPKNNTLPNSAGCRVYVEKNDAAGATWTMAHRRAHARQAELAQVLFARLSTSLTGPFSTNVLNRRFPQGCWRLAADSSPGDEKSVASDRARAHGAAGEAQGRQQVCATGLASSRQHCTGQGDATCCSTRHAVKALPVPLPRPGSQHSGLTGYGWPGGARWRRTQQGRRLRSCGASTGFPPRRRSSTTSVL